MHLTIPERLRASLRVDALHGNNFELGVVARQISDAADEIERLQVKVAKQQEIIDRYVAHYPKCKLLHTPEHHVVCDCGLHDILGE